MLHTTPRIKPRNLARYDQIPPGGNRFNVSRDLWPARWTSTPKQQQDRSKWWGRMRWNRPAPTLTGQFANPNSGCMLHPQWERNGVRVNRAISAWEAARIQGFPDSWRWCGTRQDIERQIGNAIPPLLAEAIARALPSPLLESQPTKSPEHV